MRPTTRSGNQEATFRTYPLSHFPLFFCCEFSSHRDGSAHHRLMLFSIYISTCIYLSGRFSFVHVVLSVMAGGNTLVRLLRASRWRGISISRRMMSTTMVRTRYFSRSSRWWLLLRLLWSRSRVYRRSWRRRRSIGLSRNRVW